jgi:putative ABC transport system substrate-binding protein
MIINLHSCNFFLKKYSVKRLVLVACVFLLIISIPSFAATPSVAVIYPELRAPYNKIFEDIADGVEKKVNGRIKRYALPKDYSSEQLDIWLKKNNIKVCVALGNLRKIFPLY